MGEEHTPGCTSGYSTAVELGSNTRPNHKERGGRAGKKQDSWSEVKNKPKKFGGRIELHNDLEGAH